MKLLAGVKGTGKTKTLIDAVNTACRESKGSVVFIEKGKKLTFDVPYQARLVDAEEYGVKDGSTLYGFICGMLAANYDITELFIDNAFAICENNLAELELFLEKAEGITAKNNVMLMVSASLDPAALSERAKAFLI